MAISGYDSWKTANPYDDEPDWVGEADKYLDRIKDKQPEDESEAHLWAMLEGLREIIKDEVGI